MHDKGAPHSLLLPVGGLPVEASKATECFAACDTFKAGDCLAQSIFDILAYLTQLHYAQC